MNGLSGCANLLAFSLSQTSFSKNANGNRYQKACQRELMLAFCSPATRPPPPMGRSGGWGRGWWLHQFQSLVSDGGLDGERVVGGASGDMDCRESELNAVILEGRFDQRVGSSADDKLFARLGHHLHSDLDREFAELFDALHLQRFDDLRRELGIHGEFRADALDNLLHRGKVGIVGDADGEFVDDPITAHVLDGTQGSERHRVEGASMMAELD